MIKIVRVGTEGLKIYAGSWALIKQYEKELDTEILNDQGIYHLALLNNLQPIGFIRSNVKACNAQQATGFIEAIYVLAEHRGAGIFTQLYNQVVGDFKKFQITKIQLEVDYTNNTAYDLYEHLGFKPKVILMECDLCG